MSPINTTGAKIEIARIDNTDTAGRNESVFPRGCDAIADGRRPKEMSEDEEMVYDFCTELQHNRRVPDITFVRIETRFGKKGVVDLTGINACYTLSAMQLNVAQYRLPEDEKKLQRFAK